MYSTYVMHPLFRYRLMTRFFLYLLICFPLSVCAQQPWQQRVHYTMDIRLDTDHHQMQGFQRLVYYNNSPDTLYKVYYHLYFNAFHPHSMMAERNRELPDPDPRIVPRIFELKPDEVGFHRILSLEQDGVPVSWDIHDTVMRVHAAHPILPGDSTVFTLRFFSQIPLQTRRSGWMNREGIEYSMSQWYPKIAAYDRRGWHADPYVGREFYGVFGTFDVRLTLPARYVVGATGVLQNPEEVGHGYGPATPEADSLTWHFIAHDVHDFAWAADPDYLHEVVEGPGGVTIHLLYQPDVAERWASMKTWVPQLMAYYNERFGPYPYPQFTVAQAGDGGMEYPMINFITGRRSPRSLLGVTAHELAHEWFYGVLANNESDYAWMDEGFTSYATTEAIHHILNLPGRPQHTGAYLSVIRALNEGYFEPLNTPSDWFLTNRGYSVTAYPGGEMLVDMLGTVISDSLRDAWLRTYYRRFQFRHPHPDDLEALAEEVSNMELDWYFDQLTRMVRTCDYAVERVRVHGDSTTITLRRKDPLILPVDVLLHFADGRQQRVHIPRLSAFGHKPVPSNVKVTSPWPWTVPRFTFTVPGHVKRVVVDPDGRTPDRNRLNNTNGLFPVRWTLFQPPREDWFTYRIGFRPLVDYAQDFGMGAGMRFQGTYLFGQHQLTFSLKAWPRHLTTLEQTLASGVDGTLRYQTSLDHGSPVLTGIFAAQKHQGIGEVRLAFRRLLGRFPTLGRTRHAIRLGLTVQKRLASPAFRGTRHTYPEETFWTSQAVLSTSAGYRITFVGQGALQWEIEAGYQAHKQAFALLTLSGTYRTPWGYLNTFGYLRTTNVPPQKVFRFGTGTPEAQWRNPAFRMLAGMLGNRLNTFTFIPLAGPMDTTVTEPLSLAATVGAGRYVSFAYGGLFASAGVTASDFLADAGIELRLQVAEAPFLRRWVQQSDVLASLNVVFRGVLLSTYTPRRMWIGIQQTF